MPRSAIPRVTLPNGITVPQLGQGTWRMGESPRTRRAEVEALQLGIELGMTLIDTAEMYGSGGAEEVVGEAIDGCRENIYLVSKVLPENATRSGTIAACEWSLARLGCDYIDLYLLHWRGGIKLAETVAAFQALMGEGLIRSWGVSNFDVDDMEDLVDVTGGDAAVTDQILYNLQRRSIEKSLMPWVQERGIPLMAYSPIEQGRLLRDPALNSVAARIKATPAQVALAWTLRRKDLIVIPKASSLQHVKENRAALEIELSASDLAALDRAFPPPDGPKPLEFL